MCGCGSVQAIRDGVIEATIDHEKGYVQSKETSDIYSTGEPMAAFHQRISFCLDIHNQSVKVGIRCRERERERKKVKMAQRPLKVLFKLGSSWDQWFCEPTTFYLLWVKKLINEGTFCSYITDWCVCGCACVCVHV